ncbi:MAG: hypothetical protein IT370_17510 [Deltaproteobacteria bacterium]|nr:hypothetical protein [Deltaproteobacteria bacterium]
MMRVATRSIFLLSVCLLGVSCSAPDPGGPVHSRSAALNNAPQIGDFAVYAKNSLVLRPGAAVSAGDLGVKDVATTMLHSGKELALEGASSVEVAHNTLGNRVFLDTGAVVGDVHTTALTDFGASHGAVAGMPTMPALPTPASVTAGTTNLTVAAGTTTTLASSTSRAAVTLNDSATLRLGAGTYQFASLKLLANARVEAEGAVEIRMTGRLTAGTNVYFGPAPGVSLTAAGLRIEVNGANGGSGGVNATPRAALIDDDGVLRALLLVPNGTSFIGQRTAITGAIAGKDIDLREDATVTREDGFGSATCVPADCNDSNACTTDVCGASGCTHTPVATGTSCADGTVCNGAETCNAGGACVSGTPLTVDDGNVCTADSCDPVTGVSHAPVAAGTSCADGTVCNGAETCDAGGACVSGTPLAVDDGNVCTADSCDPVTGVAHTPVAAGASCADGTVCNGAETCDAGGTCLPGPPAVVDDGNVCTADSCDPTSGVAHAPVAAGTSCADGSVCNGAETCNAGGACTAGIPPSVDDGNVCTADSCDPISGVAHTPVAAGTSCADSTVCNGAETCNASGTCIAGVPPSTDDANPCTADSCDPIAGVAHTPVVAGTSCADGTVCNGAETCDAGGSCVAGAPPAVDDGNACTADSCDAVTGVAHTPVATGTSCADADLCNGAEVCDTSGTCEPGAPVAADDGNACTTDACDPVSGSVAHSPLATGSACSDGDPLNGPEACSAASVCSPYDPVLVAPPIDQTVAMDLYDAAAFLWSGANPIQTGVTPGAIDRNRVSVVRGSVTDRSGIPIRGVRISILGEPSLGTTLTRADGAFDMVVNGGRPLIVDYQKAGLIPVQRTVDALWHDYFVAGDVVMIPFDPEVTTISLAGATTVQTARGGQVSDTAGTRTATLLFKPGTSASMRLADGTTTALETLHVRATEYTVGNTGRAAMPAELPPQSAFTYAVELSVDEAVSANAVSVDFSQPVYGYLEELVGAPVGTGVPSGFYDRVRGEWVASQTGKVIRVVGISGGIADLDVTGDGTADTGAALSILSITDAERQILATLYPAGQKLWRVPIPHFSPWDWNWPWAAPRDMAEFVAKAVSEGNDPCKAGPSVNCEDGTATVDAPIEGGGITLSLQTGNQPGYAARREIKSELVGSHLPPSLLSVKVRTTVAGQSHSATFAPSANLGYSFVWDGKDAYGRDVQGSAVAEMEADYEYTPQYYADPAEFAQTFARYTGELNGTASFTPPTVSGRSGATVTVTQRRRLRVGGWNADGEAMGGWSPSVHHKFDPAALTLYMGDGTTVRQASKRPNPTLIAGTGALGLPPIGPVEAPATAVPLGKPGRMAADETGNIYFVDELANRVYKKTTGGVLISIAGSGLSGGSGDGGPANQAQLRAPQGVAVDRFGSVFIADTSNHRVRRVGPDGIITTVAGTGSCFGDPTMGGIATSVPICSPQDVVFAENSLIITSPAPSGADVSVYRVGTDLHLTRIKRELSGVAGLAGGVSAPLAYASGGDHFIRFPGILSPFNAVGQNRCGNHLDLFANIQLSPVDIAYDDRESDWILAALHGGPAPGIYRIKVPSSTGINFVAPGFLTCPIEGLFVLPVGGAPEGLVVTPSHQLCYTDANRHVVECVQLSYPGGGVLGLGGLGDTTIVPSPDGNEVYEFTKKGRHLRTLDALTGVPLLRFFYDSSGRLDHITDLDGRVTRFERDAAGGPAAIEGPFGQRTIFTTDAHRRIATVTNPAGEITRYAHRPDGLLDSQTDAEGHVTSYEYSAKGEVQRIADPAGGFSILTRAVISGGTQSTVTSALGRSATHRRESIGVNEHRTTTAADGLVTSSIERAFGPSESHTPDGMTTVVTPGADPRWGVSAVRPAVVTVTTPGGRTSTASHARIVTLANPSDPLSLIGQVDTYTENGKTNTETFNAGLGTLTLMSPAGRTSTSHLDVRGRIWKSEVPGLLPVTTVYDNLGRVESVTQGTRTTAWSYDLLGRVATITDALGRVTTMSPNAANRLDFETLPGGRQIGYTYNQLGAVRSITPPGRPAHSIDYDPVGRVTEQRAPSTGGGDAVSTQTYDLDHDPDLSTDPDGRQTRTVFLANGRFDRTEQAEGNTRTGYDAAGRASLLTAPDGGQITRAFDGSLLLSESWAGAVSGQVAWDYGPGFRLASQRVNSLPAVAFGYDDDGLLTSAGDLTVARDLHNGLVRGSVIGGVVDDVQYNGHGEPVVYSTTFGGAPVYQATVSRDDLGRAASITEVLGGVTTVRLYGYDVAGRLETVTQNGVEAERYAYDSNGNRTTRTLAGATQTAVPDAQDRLTSAGPETFIWSQSGELRTRTNTTTGAVTQYGYDSNGSLTSAELPDSRNVEYIIDATGRRIGKRVDGVLVEGFIYQDALRPAAWLDGTGAVRATFVYAHAAGAPDLMLVGPSSYRLVKDNTGSVRMVLDVASGVVAQRIEYDAWGQVVLDTSPGFQPFGYTGALVDRDTGLVHLGAREYDPGLGRFTTKDPLSFGGGDTNLLAYVANDPINHVDPTGLFSFQTFANWSAGFGDALTFGLTRKMRGWFGIADAVDTCSSAYRWGELSGIAGSFVIPWGLGAS